MDDPLGSIGQQSAQQWMDLSFLKIPGEKRVALFKSRYSLLVCGTDDTHWVGYCFVDRDLKENHFDEDDFCQQELGKHEDPISCDSGGHSIDANIPIADPRAYFLVITEIRIAGLCKGWECLIRLLECSIELYV
jgi:hypothetical protein